MITFKSGISDGHFFVLVPMVSQSVESVFLTVNEMFFRSYKLLTELQKPSAVYLTKHIYFDYLKNIGLTKSENII